MAELAWKEVPEVFTIDKLVQLRVMSPEERANIKNGDEEPLRFYTFTATRDEVIEAGIKALQDKTHPDYVDWRTLVKP